MGGTESRFLCNYELLCEKEPRLGRIAVLPWDAEIFGFPVAEYQLGETEFLLENRHAWLDSLSQWVQGSRARLIACSTDAIDLKATGLLSRSAFTLVDTSLQADLFRLQAVDLPAPRLVFRPMEEAIWRRSSGLPPPRSASAGTIPTRSFRWSWPTGAMYSGFTTRFPIATPTTRSLL